MNIEDLSQIKQNLYLMANQEQGALLLKLIDIAIDQQRQLHHLHGKIRFLEVNKDLVIYDNKSKKEKKKLDKENRKRIALADLAAKAGYELVRTIK